MKLVRERPSQRLHHRVEAPLYVDINGTSQRVANWSLGGFRIDAFEGDVPAVGQALECSCTLPFQGFSISFKSEAEVIRRHGATSFAAQFRHLGERERALMAHFVEELVRGSMVPAEDTIQRIDVPITPVSTDPNINPAHGTPVRRRPFRALGLTALHVVLGGLVVGYAATLLYTHFYRMEVETAVISAPLELVAAQGDGRIGQVLVQQGDAVGAGQPVMLIADNDLEQRIDMARLQVEHERSVYATLDNQLVEERQRLRDYGMVSATDIQQVGWEIRALESQLTTARARRDRMAELFAQGWVKKYEIEEAESAFATAGSQLQARKLHRKDLETLSKRGDGKRFFDGAQFRGEIVRLDSERRRAQAAVERAEQELEALIQHRERLAVRAPFAGRVLDIAVGPDSAIARGTTLATFERENNRLVDAYLTQDEVFEVGLNDTAVVYVPALDTRLEAEVVRVDRTRGFVDEQHARYSWRAPMDRSALVSLRFADPVVAAEAGVRAGLPASVIFKRRSGNELLAELRRPFKRAEPPQETASTYALPFRWSEGK